LIETVPHDRLVLLGERSRSPYSKNLAIIFITWTFIYLRRPVDRDEAQLYQRDTRKHSGTRKCNNY